MKLLWLDLETSGLDERVGHVFEIGAIVTDEWLHEIESVQAIVSPPPGVVDSLSPEVARMHGSNGLLEALKAPDLPSLESVDSFMASFIEEHWGPITQEDHKPILCGSSIHFDRRWLRHHMPIMEALLYRRMLDVSALKILMQVYRPDWTYVSSYHVAHRTLQDCRGSIAEFRHYLDTIGIRGLSPVVGA